MATVSCQSGYSAINGAICTKIITSASAWTAAQTTCAADGGNLLTITSSTINAAIFSTYSANVPFWIGLNDQATEGTFVWPGTTPFSYSNWGGTEPDNTGPAGGGADCVIMNASGLWYDRVCGDANRFICQTPPLTSAPTSAPTSDPTLAPTTAPSSQPTSAPTMYIPACGQYLSFDDSHGSYETWMTSFIKYEGNFAADDDDDFGFRSGYIPFMDALDISAAYGVKPAIILALRYGPGATFSVVSGKLDSAGALMPCDIQAAGSGPCFDSRSWEIGLSAKSLLNSVFTTETSAWIAPYGSSMTNECFPESEVPAVPDSRLRPAVLTGEARSHNNVRPPSFHAPPPPPHASVELSLTMKDGAGFGWWNTLKFHPNQYVLDNGEEILHRGTLVDKAEDTDKFRLPDGSYSLRMLGNLDVDAGDDTWTLMMKDQVIAYGGRYDRLSFTVSKGQLTGIVSENVLDLLGPHSANTYPLAAFEGLVTPDQLKTMTHDPALLEVESAFVERLFGDKMTLTSSASTVPTFNDALRSNSMEFVGFFVASALFGMVTLMGVSRFFSPSSKHSYSTVMDESTSAPRKVEIKFEEPLKKVSQELTL